MLDERYLFTGARFVVYLVSTVPIVVLLALVVLGVVYVPFRLMPKSARASLCAVLTMGSHPVRLTFAGMILSVLMIQGVMRQCFFYSNLLLGHSLSAGPSWLAHFMCNDALMSLFFSGLIAGTVIPAAVLFSVCRSLDERRSFKLLCGLLAFLVAVQVLLLPVNYGELSSRDLVQMMAERGILLAHTTILRWVQRYVPDFEKRWQTYARPVGDSWRVDETYLKIKGNGSTSIAPWIKRAAPSTFPEQTA